MHGVQTLSVPGAALSGPAKRNALAPATLRRRRRRLLARLALGFAGTGSILLASAAVLQGGAGSAPAANAPKWVPHLWSGIHLDLSGGGRLDLRRPELQLSTAAFDLHVRERLPLYKTLFQQAALSNGLDWRLLAAVAYQESNWDTDSVSPTGVRGIMMLALDTATELAVDREDPAECIEGGAAYFQQIRDRLPRQIHEPDRTNMALAAYNQGLGHLQDARALAAQLGGDPNSWKDVRTALPLLAQEQWFSQARHGYADGAQAVRYVTNVRKYYERMHGVPAGPLPAPFLIANTAS